MLLSLHALFAQGGAARRRGASCVYLQHCCACSSTALLRRYRYTPGTDTPSPPPVPGSESARGSNAERQLHFRRSCCFKMFPHSELEPGLRVGKI